MARLDGRGDHLGIEHQPADRPVVGAPGSHRPADPVDLAVAIDIGSPSSAQLDALGQDLGVQDAPLVGDLGKDLVVQAADQRHVGRQVLVGQILPRGRQIAHAEIEDGDAHRRVLQRRRHAGRRGQEGGILDHGRRLPSREKILPDHFMTTLGYRRSHGLAPLSRADGDDSATAPASHSPCLRPRVTPRRGSGESRRIRLASSPRHWPLPCLPAWVSLPSWLARR
jgi:hypothetical protein